MKTRWASLILFLTFALTGCIPSQTNVTESPNLVVLDSTREPPSTSLTAQPTHGNNTQMNPLLPTPSSSSLGALVEAAKANLAQRLSIPASDITLVEAKEVVWSDGSLGCPQPGMLYTQALTPGYLIKLKYDSHSYEYHAGKDRPLTYCENPLPPVESMPGDT